MTRLLFVLALFVSAPAFASDAMPHSGGFGAGLEISNRGQGINAKYYFGNTFAVQGDLSFGRHWGNTLAVQAVWAMPRLIDHSQLAITWYPGVGGAFDFSSNTLAAQGVLGAALHLKPAPIEIVGEIRPTLIAEFGLSWQFLLGARYYLQ